MQYSYCVCNIYYIYYLLCLLNCITRIRLKTWERLKSIKGGTFTSILQTMLDIHETLSLLTLPHYHALERRLKIIYATVVMCQRKSDKSILK